MLFRSGGRKVSALLKNLKRDDSVSLGRRLLNHALGGSRKLNEIPQENIQRELDRMKLATLDDLLAEIGLGNAMSVVVAKNLQHGDASIPPATQSHGHLPIKGADGVLITFAKCCRPIPGDPIIAHVSPGKGLVIHHESCRNIRENPVPTSVACSPKSLGAIFTSRRWPRQFRNGPAAEQVCARIRPCP